MFKRDIFYLDGGSYSLCSPRPGKITVTPKEFIKMATTITITKDNIRNYAIQRLESKTIREQVVLALEKLGEKTISVRDTVFTETKIVEDDYFRFNGRSWETHGSAGIGTIILKPSEFLKAVAHLLLSTNPRDYAIETIGDALIRQQVIDALNAANEPMHSSATKHFINSLSTGSGLFFYNGNWSYASTIPTRTIVTPESFLKMHNAGKFVYEAKPTPKRILPSTNEQLNYYIANDLGKELLKCLGIVSNCKRFPVPAGTWNLDSLLAWNYTPQGRDFWRDHRVNTKYMKDIPATMLNDYLKQCIDSTVAAIHKPSSVLDQFLAGPIPTDNKFITYVHKNNLGEEILKAIEVKSSMNRSYPYTSGNNINFNLMFCWAETPQGHDFWSGHHIKSGCSVDGGLLTKYLEAYKEARSGVMPKAVENMTNPIKKLPSVVAGQIYTYNKTKTKYRVRVASVSSNSYTLETLTTNRTADWCKNISLDRVHEIFTLHTDIPSAPSPSCPEATTPFKVGDKVRLKPDLRIGSTYGNKPYITLLSEMVFIGVKTIKCVGKGHCDLDGGFTYSNEMLELDDGCKGITSKPVLDNKIIINRGHTSVGTPIYYFDSTAAISVGALASRTELTPTKGKPMPKTLKDNAVELVQENKAAAFTAAEIKAGQIINKQAISLIKPKLPMMVRGYADSPVASVVLANVVALGLKHYAAGNKKLEKISELMIAGAAFDSIDALNIDGIVNDFIAGLKLPAGVEIE